jgi:phosphate transport system substrate-binding protein
MNRRGAMGLVFLIVFSVTLAGTPVPVSAQENQKISVIGSRYLYFAVTDFARIYSDKNPDAPVTVTSSDENEAFRRFLAKEADAFMAFRRLDKDEKAEAADAGINLQEQAVGWGAVALVVHPQNPVGELTVEQVRKIFLGEYTNWNQVGGPDERIVPMTREESVSGTEVFFRETVLNGFPVAQHTLRVLDHDIVRAVKQEKGAIADARFFEGIRGRIKGLVKIAAVKEDDDAPAIMPSEESLKNRTYPISGPLYLYYALNGSKQQQTIQFVEFCLNRGIGARYTQIQK